jgi:hypothetical protein
MFWLAWKYLLFGLIHPQDFLNKKATLKIESAALNGGQGKLSYFVYFVRPPRESGM